MSHWASERNQRGHLLERLRAMERSEETIFAGAIEKSADERAAYLDAVCEGDPGLRRNVESLLQAYGEGSFLESPPLELPDTIDQPLIENSGTKIGPYKLLQEIGQGGMGVVYMAEQTQPVRRKVALKVIKPGMDSNQVVSRFEAERQALAMMDHVNIARVFDGGTTENGRPYFVMELVHGVPITKYCDDNRLTPRQRLELFVSVCQAIQHAHQKGIIHRDIKPSNVMVTLYDGKPVPKVIDFGVAKATEQKLTERTLFTQYGTMVGTLEYMSPEQAEMSALGVDTRSDIFSLGILLYELLTGSTPLSSKRMKEAAFAEILRMIQDEEPPKPSTRLSDSGEALASISAQRHMEPAKLAKLVRGEVDWIVMKALEKDRNRRYETANGFASDVQRYLADETVEACPPSAAYRFRKFARRNKRGLASATVVALAVLLVAGTLGWAVRDREAQAQEVAQERAVRQAAVEQEVSLALKEAERWQDQAEWPEALSAAKRAEGLLVGVGDGELRERANQLRKDLEMVLRLDEIQLLRSELKKGQFDNEKADRAYAQAFADYGIDVMRLPVEEPAARIRARAGVAVPLIVALDDWAAACSAKDQSHRLALKALARAADPDPWRRQVRQAVQQKDSQALAVLATSPQLVRQPPASIMVLANELPAHGLSQTHTEVLRRAQQQYPGNFWINYGLGVALYKIGPPDRDEAISFFRAALAIRPRSAVAYYGLACGLQKQDKLDEAIAAYRQAIEFNPTYAPAYSALGGALSEQKKLPEAIAACHKAIKLDPKDAIAYNNLARVFQHQKQLDEAFAAYRKAIELDPKDARIQTNLGFVLYQQGKLVDAIAAYRKAIEFNPTYAYAYSALGGALGAQKKLPEAIAACHKAIELDPKDASAYNNLSAALGDQKKLPEALAALLKAIELDPKNAEFQANFGFLLYQQGKLVDAIAVCRKTIELDPKLASPHNCMGMALRSQGRVEEAISCYLKAIELDPKDASVHSNLGIALSAQKKPDEAIACYKKAIELNPKHVNAHICLGNAYYRQKKLDEAMDCFRKAIALDPKHGNAHYAVGVVLKAQGHLNEAIACFRKTIEFDPEHEEVHAVLGNALAARGWELANHPDPNLRDLKRAVESGMEAVELAPESVSAWQYLGWVQYQAGSWQASIKALEKSCRLQEGGTDDSGQWIVMSLAHGKLANEKGLTAQERAKHLAEARRLYDQAAKQIDGWGSGDSVTQAIRAFRAEAAEMLEDKEKAK